MLRSGFLIVLIFALANISLAQVRAVTESGKSVLLFDNGTWQYEENKEATPAIVSETIIAPAVTIDSNRVITTELTELFYLPSPRLTKYFGDDGGNIRCKLSSSNNLGVVKIKFSWEFPVVDCNRYYGTFSDGTAVIFTMANGQQVQLMIEGKSSISHLEKHNYSVMTNGTYPLTMEQLTALSTQPIKKMEVGWKKKSEEYLLENSRVLMDELPSVF